MDATNYRASVQVTSTLFIPLLTPAADDPFGDPAAPVLDEFTGPSGLAVAYSFGPPYGERLVSWRDLDTLGLDRRVLRQQATGNLDAIVDNVRIHGQPPLLTLSFDGMESSLLLAAALWETLAGSVAGEIVVGVPARDVVVVTGARSEDGLGRVKSTVERVFSAGDQFLLTRQLLVRRDGGWQRFTSRVPSQRQP